LVLAARSAFLRLRALCPASTDGKEIRRNEIALLESVLVSTINRHPKTRPPSHRIHSIWIRPLPGVTYCLESKLSTERPVQTADVAPITGRRVIFVLEPFSFPSGGVAVIYQHAEILAENGIPAYVALPRQPAEDFYGSRARLIIHHGKLPFRRGDIFVIPEGFPAYVKALMATPVKRLMFCQNQYYLPFTNDPGSGFAEFGVHGLIASSQTIGDFFRDVYGLTDIPLIPCAVDPAIYSVASRKRRQVAYMPRKLPAEAAFIQAVFRRRHQR
jgi:hypothetical protein